jgi:hypothetical protein
MLQEPLGVPYQMPTETRAASASRHRGRGAPEPGLRRIKNLMLLFP